MDENGITCEDRSVSAIIRKSIWEYCSGDLGLDNVEIDVTQAEAKSIWEKLKGYMPIYALFQSDRKNSDSDSEVQDPVKFAVKEALMQEGIPDKLNEIAIKIEQRLHELSKTTLEKLREMNPEIANQLQAQIPPIDKLKWDAVFKSVSIISNDGIPINKRGSGVRRLVLINFFRAEVERRRNQENSSSVIFAIEEPETSQHPDHQNKLIQALIELSQADNTQVILTTHSPAIVKKMGFENIRLIKTPLDIVKIQQHELPYPSLNEVNYLAFGESDEEYHDELYGHITIKDWLDEYKSRHNTVAYVYQNNDGSKGNTVNITMTEYIRHQIHHPENKINIRYTHEELQESIQNMRDFLQEKENNN